MTELDALLSRIANYGRDISHGRLEAERDAFRMLPEVVRRLKEAEADTARLDWLLPVASLADGPTDARTTLIVGVLMLGKTGRDGLDEAMAAEAHDGTPPRD